MGVQFTENGRCRRKLGVRRGAAAVELAVVSAFLFLPLLIGIFEVGRGVIVAEMLEDAARKACNTGCKPDKTYSNTTADATDILTDNGIDSTQATVTVQVASYVYPITDPPTWGPFVTVTSDATFIPQQFDLIAVQVSIPAAKVLWFTPFFFNNQNIISSKVIMMRAGAG